MTRALALGIWLLLLPALGAAEPLVIELPPRANPPSCSITVGHVGKISGGTVHSRAKVGRIDLAEIGPKESTAVISRRQVEFRLRLAGYDEADFVVVGSERTTAHVVRRPIPADDVVAAAKTELLIRLNYPSADIAVTTLQNPSVKLPEVAAEDDVQMIAVPHAGTVSLGRTQMDVSILVRGETRLSLPVFFETKLLASAPAIQRVGAVELKVPEVGKVVIVKLRQRVKMFAQIGDLRVETVGEAMQDGKFGQSIRVLNIDSKKTISARVTGPETVEVELAGGGS